MFLTPEEIVILTGRRRKDAQAQALKAMGVEHIVRPDGAVLVSVERVKNLLGCSVTKPEKPFTPNWQALA